MATQILEKKKDARGIAWRLQKRGSAFDVIYLNAGISWRYMRKAVSESEARNVFDFHVSKP
jgi:hypothetical protein